MPSDNENKELAPPGNATASNGVSNGDEARSDPNPIPVRDVLRRIGPTEDIRAYVYRTLIDIMPDRIYAKDTMCRFILANRAVAHLMGGMGPEDLIGKTDFDFYEHELAERYVAVEQQVLHSGEPLIAYEQYTPNLATGEPQWTQTTKVPLRDFEGRVIGLVGLARDVTERRRFEDEIRQQNQELAAANAKLLQMSERLLQSGQPAPFAPAIGDVGQAVVTALASACVSLEQLQARLDAGGDAESCTLLDAARRELQLVLDVVPSLRDPASDQSRSG